MSFFKNIFGSSENENQSNIKMDWEPLNHIDQLNEIIAESKDKPVAIFKHSTRCSISRMALKQFENEFANCFASMGRPAHGGKRIQKGYVLNYVASMSRLTEAT